VNIFVSKYQAEEAEAAPAAPAQAHFNIKLLVFDDKAKLKVIKKVKDLFPGINVVEVSATSAVSAAKMSDLYPQRCRSFLSFFLVSTAYTLAYLSYLLSLPQLFPGHFVRLVS
jgi:phage tail sheath gpL-like